MDNPWADATDAHQEADLATPSWSTGVAVRWAEPSDLDASLWDNNTTAVPLWTPPKSPYDDIPIGRPSLQEVSRPDSPVSERHDSTDFQTAPTTPTSPKVDSLLSPSSPARETTPQIIPTRPESPDGFGTFETADAWTSSASTVAPSSLDEDNAWGAAWSPASDHDPSEEDQPHIDEWELAKLQKQKQDQHVPPELLDSVLEQLKELSSDLWPESKLDDGETRQPTKDFILDLPNLKPAVDKFVPDDLVLSANVQFTRTFTSKHMNEALRLTRHLPMTQSSPMAIYMASKGSTAWELSVKSRQDIQEDVLPAGWRMVEKNKQELVPAPEVKKKAGGGLLSFLGLKSSDASGEPSPQKSSPSPSRPGSMIGSSKSQRSSLDGGSKPASERRSSISQHSIPSTALVSPSSASLPPITSPDSEQKSALETTSQTAPSTVSRFFGRFSRSSANSTSQSRSQSLALSSDDIEFLSDIVPNAADDDENLENLTNVISAKSPSASPLPQLLPPPPKPSRPASSIFTSKTMPKADDPFSLLDSFTAEQPLTGAESKSIQPLVSTVPLTTTSAPNSSTLPLARQTPKPTSTLPITNSRTQSFLVPLPPPPQRRGITAIMTGSGRSTPSNLQSPLPPPPLPPPPASPLSAMPPPALVQVQQTSLFDDEEFSDFLSSPATAGPPLQPSISQAMSNNASIRSIGASRVSASPSISSLSSIVSDESLLPSRSINFGLDGFASPSKKNSYKNKKSDLRPLEDGFNEFVSSSMTSTVPLSPPPRPPAKPMARDTRPSQPAPLASLMQTKDRDSLPPSPPRKPSRTADHSRTLSLLESAAARPGQWPAPPSPQPKTIAPPPPPPPPQSQAPLKNVSFNIFNDMEPPRRQIGGQMPLTSNALWNLPPPPSSLPSRALSPPPALMAPNKANGVGTGNLAPSSFWSLGENSLTPTPAAKSSKTTGGLSEQDLSFFEGL